MRATINLYNENCLPAMKKMADNQYSLAIVDPPYGIGNTWSKSKRDRFYKIGDNYTYKNDKIPSKEYFEQLLRVSENQIIWGGNYYTEYLRPTNSWIIWDKVRNADVTFMSEAELAWTSFQKVTRIIRIQWDGAKKGKETGLNKIHPFQKPLALYKWTLNKFAKEGYKILDTHFGSLSIGIACWDAGYDLDAWEIDRDYFEAGKKRLENHKAQLRLY